MAPGPVACQKQIRYLYFDPTDLFTILGPQNLPLNVSALYELRPKTAFGSKNCKPDRAFYNARALKSVDRRILWRSIMSFDEFWCFNFVKVLGRVTTFCVQKSLPCVAIRDKMAEISIYYMIFIHAVRKNCQQAFPPRNGSPHARDWKPVRSMINQYPTRFARRRAIDTCVKKSVKSRRKKQLWN